jgi:beta-phosphoglucomutase family hydrolase
MQEKNQQRSRSQIASIGPLDTQTIEIPADKFDAVLFDMDGVVTKTAILHTTAWKDTFDQWLESKARSEFKKFSEEDYQNFVDGKAREDGIRSFVQSRHMQLPEGLPRDEPGLQSVCAVSKLKNVKFLKLLRAHGVEVYETTVVLVAALKAAGIRTAIVTASRNGAEILQAANLAHLFDVKVDGVDAERLRSPGKPHPDLFLEAARQLGVAPQRIVVIEDSAAGVESGHKGGFGLVVGIARANNFDLLKEHGADVVVADLAEVRISGDKLGRTPGMVLAELNVSDQNWVITYDEFSPELEEQRESLCALGNGYFCTRGAMPGSHDDGTHYPGTYLAGGYNRVRFNEPDHQFVQEQLVNLPNWLAVGFKINDGEWFDLGKVEILKYQQRLDLRQGVLYRDIKFRDHEGQVTSLNQRSFVHMRHPHLAALETIWTAHNWSGAVTIHSALDGTVTNNSVHTVRPDNEKHLEYLYSTIREGTLCLGVVTDQSRLMIAQATSNTLMSHGKRLDSDRLDIIQPGFVAQELKSHIAQNGQITLQKIVALYTSRDRGISEASESAFNAIAGASDFETLLSEQIDTWRLLWRQFDLFVDTTETHSKIAPSLLLHLHAFHTLQTASPNTIDLDVGLPARGWTGEGYQGQIFWDALFVFPYINFRMPAITASMLKYRYRRLDAARAIAKSIGACGARFPWQSGSDGRENTPTSDWNSAKKIWCPDNSAMQVHVNASIAYNICQYYQVTADLDFMNVYGAEMLFEIARFFASFATYNPKSLRYEIRGVVGPDEFHTAYPGADKYGIDNNAYTNIMAVWTLSSALELMQILATDHRNQLLERLKITKQETDQWDVISRNMYVPFLDNGVISQFDGFEKLSEFPTLSDGALDIEKLNHVLQDEGGTPNEFKVCKQADVLMLFYVLSAEELKELFNRLGYKFESDDIRTNIDYYLPKTANDSTLSRIAHAWVLSRLDRRRSWKLLAPSSINGSPVQQENTKQERHSWPVLMEALDSDYRDIHHASTSEGVHQGAMAGTLDIVQRCYTGMVIRKNVLWLSPQLPRELARLSFGLHYRGQALQFDITQDVLKITALHTSALPINIGFEDLEYELKAGDTKVFLLQAAEPQSRAV